MLTPEDKTGFSDLIQDVTDTEVDVLINSPGGFAEVTEAIVSMLRSKFDSVRFAVPNMAKSAATLLALSGDELLLDHRSELGPIDPQVEYQSTDGRKREAAEDILDGFDEAKRTLVKEGPAAIPAYAPLLNKYSLGLLRGCMNAKQLSETLAIDWLKKYMFKGQARSQKPRQIARYFASHSKTLSHNRAICIDRCDQLGVKMVDLREPENGELDEAIWNLWCVYELHFERAAGMGVYKIYENSSGCSLQKQRVEIQIVPGPPQVPQGQRPQK